MARFASIGLGSGLRLLLTDRRERVIANADHTIAKGFASLINYELYHWKLQLETPGSILYFTLFHEHVFTSGESCIQYGLCNTGPRVFNTDGY